MQPLQAENFETPKASDLQSRVTALEQLLEVYEHAALEQGQKLQDAISALNQRAAELALSEERLQAQTRELERSNGELEQFAYVASHDLQEPLRMVSGFAQLLARRYKGKLDDDADEFIDYMVKAVVRMQQLINDLLLYSRVGSKAREFKRVSMEDVFEHATANLTVALQESQAHVTRDPLPAVIGDELQLVELLQNLIANAVKFRSAEPPRIHVSASFDGEQATVAVRDNGIGIDPQYCERIFIIFQRLHTVSEYPGTGIGLAICKKIVDRHGGRIWVESEPGRGCIFYFTLRREDQ